MRTLDLQIGEKWTAFAGSRNIPYLGVAAHIDWIEKNRDSGAEAVRDLQGGGRMDREEPGRGREADHAEGPAEDQKAVADLIRSNERLGLNVRWAADLRKEIEAVYAAGDRSASSGTIRENQRLSGTIGEADEQPRPALMRVAQILAPFVLLAVLWQIASFYFPKYLFPSLIDVFAHIVAIFSSWALFAEVLATVGRILAGLIGAFVAGAMIAALMFQSRAPTASSRRS